jgi:hypothetical protein
MHRVQAEKLRHKEEQEKRPGQIGTEEILQVLPQAHDAQGNQVIRITQRKESIIMNKFSKLIAVLCAIFLMISLFAVPAFADGTDGGNDSGVVDGDGTRMWELAFNMMLNGTEYNGAVFINSQTGEVEAIEYTTLGNG